MAVIFCSRRRSLFPVLNILPLDEVLRSFKHKMDVDLLQEVRLYENSTERERVDNMCELYAVLTALECLEKCFSRDCVSAKEYTAECSKLLVQYKLAVRLLKLDKIEDFVEKYRVDCHAALERIKEDRPITIKDDKGNTLKCIAEIVEMFITFLDQLKLNVRAVDELFPTLNELNISISAMSSLPDNFESKLKVKSWHDRLRDMSASEEISDEDARQMIFDVETAYNSFTRFLHNS